MLAIIVRKQLIRRSLREKLHLCKKDIASFRKYDTLYGAICVYTLSTYGNIDKAERRLREAVPYFLYSSSQKADDEYIKRALIETALKSLNKKRKCTVYLTVKPCLNHIISLCSMSARLYTSFPLTEEEKLMIFKDCGTLPVFSKIPVPCDLIIDKNMPFEINLPESLQEICPEEFSKVLFCSLIYKENGSFIL